MSLRGAISKARAFHLCTMSCEVKLYTRMRLKKFQGGRAFFTLAINFLKVADRAALAIKLIIKITKRHCAAWEPPGCRVEN